MRGRHHRNRLAGDVDAQLQATRVDGRKVLPDEVGALVRDVQVHTVQPVPLHFVVDGARHDVARRQFGPAVVQQHEALAGCGAGRGRQQQPAAFAAHRLADQKALGMRVVQAGRMELDEFHVGHRAARAPGRGDAVAGGGVGVGGVEVHLARAAGGHDGVRRAKGVDLVALFIKGVEPEAAVLRQAPLAAGDQVDQHVVLKHADAGRLPHLRDQGLLHRGASGVGGMHDAACAVAAFARQVQLALLLRKRNALRLQPRNALRRMLDHEAGGRRIGQAGAGHQRVVHMRIEAVARGQHGGNAALRPVARTVTHRALGQHRHPVGGGQVQRRRQACQSAAHDQHVEIEHSLHRQPIGTPLRPARWPGARRSAQRPRPG